MIILLNPNNYINRHCLLSEFSQSSSYHLRWVWACLPQPQKQQQLCVPLPPASVAAPPLIHAGPEGEHRDSTVRNKGYHHLILYSFDKQIKFTKMWQYGK